CDADRNCQPDAGTDPDADAQRNPEPIERAANRVTDASANAGADAPGDATANPRPNCHLVATARLGGRHSAAHNRPDATPSPSPPPIRPVDPLPVFAQSIP